jgi:hypothetical protein
MKTKVTLNNMEIVYNGYSIDTIIARMLNAFGGIVWDEGTDDISIIGSELGIIEIEKI